MTPRKDSYRQFSRNMTFISIGMALVFVVYLIAAASGIGWLKVVCAIVAILGSLLSLVLLYLTQEWAKPRSIWLTTVFLSITLCTIVSILCQFP